MQQNTALLVMDMQLTVLAGLTDTKTLLSNVANAIANARNKNIPVIYVVVGFRAGAPEISQNNKIFGGGKERYSAVTPDEMIKVHPDLAPAANEVTVVKRRISAFTGSDLEVILRAQEIKHIVLTGFATSGVVLSTLREAADKDYRITVLADCCEDRDEEIHRVLTTKVFMRQADVITLGEWNEM
ncbi:isochorismatase family cysteine hydrolase [Mucilaginibacter sp. OK098]|uniref:isochorismatase family cysteine hydrolase n=1 Tax=Mucilaginibacter sp. OK098 TaxID=1855297 RepID=UPI000917A7DE|nr:isochorismatase family cysteine hydrolase [Mucilaginibacter sp. OK098]SHN01145.1 Nicotinamidase-related amidase [Mucilaginibacter sp. OK098]